MKTLIPITLSAFLLVSCSKEPFITKHDLKIVNEESNEILYETNDEKKIEGIVNQINKAKRTDTWESGGSIYKLVLTNGEHRKEAMYFDGEYDDEISIDGFYVYTKFDLIDR